MVINSSGDVSISLHANKLFGELLEDEAITEKFSLKKMVYGITRKQLISLMISVILLHVH